MDVITVNYIDHCADAVAAAAASSVSIPCRFFHSFFFSRLVLCYCTPSAPHPTPPLELVRRLTLPPPPIFLNATAVVADGDDGDNGDYDHLHHNYDHDENRR